MGVDDKPGIGFEPYPQRVEGAVGDLDDLVAHFTDQVVVDVIGQMPAGGAVADVDVKGDIEPFEEFEGAIDRGQVDIGVLGPYRVGQLLSGEVVITAVEGFDHRPSVNGDPSAGEPNRLDCLLDPFRRHLGERSGREWNGGGYAEKGYRRPVKGAMRESRADPATGYRRAGEILFLIRFLFFSRRYSQRPNNAPREATTTVPTKA